MPASPFRMRDYTLDNRVFVYMLFTHLVANNTRKAPRSGSTAGRVSSLAALGGPGSQDLFYFNVMYMWGVGVYFFVIE